MSSFCLLNTVIRWLLRCKTQTLCAAGPQLPPSTLKPALLYVVREYLDLHVGLICIEKGTNIEFDLCVSSIKLSIKFKAFVANFSTV